MMTFIANHSKRCIALLLVIKIVTEGKYILIELENKIETTFRGVEDVLYNTTEPRVSGMKYSLVTTFIQIISGIIYSISEN